MITPEIAAMGREKARANRELKKIQMEQDRVAVKALTRVDDEERLKAELAKRNKEADPVTTYAIMELVDELASKHGLSENQQRFFRIRHAFGTDVDACKHLGLGANSASTWRAKGSWNWEGYREARKEYQERIKEITIQEMSALGFKAVRRTEELLDATMEIKGKVIPDRTARAKGIEIYSRWSGLWTPKEQNTGNPVYVAVMNNFTNLLQKKAEALTLDGNSIIIEEQ